MVHPWIKERIRAEVDAARTDAAVRLIVLDAAVMLEAGWHDVCDRLVFIDAPREARLRRVAEQRGWTAEELEAREAAQLPLTAKAAHADHTLDNSASLEAPGAPGGRPGAALGIGRGAALDRPRPAPRGR